MTFNARTSCWKKFAFRCATGIVKKCATGTVDVSGSCPSNYSSGRLVSKMEAIFEIVLEGQTVFILHIDFHLIF